MKTLKHKWLGTATIIRREGDRMTIKYDKSDSEVILTMSIIRCFICSL